MSHINLEKKNLHEVHARKIRENDRDLKRYKELLKQHSASEAAVEQLKQQLEKTKAEVSSPFGDG